MPARLPPDVRCSRRANAEAGGGDAAEALEHLRILGLTTIALAWRDPVNPEGRFRVSVPEFLIEQEDRAATRVRFFAVNQEETPVFVARCGDRIMAALDRREGFQWMPYSTDLCEAIHMSEPVEMLPGEARSDIRTVQEVGRYRIRNGTQRDRNGATRWSVTSNAFEVR